MREFTITVSKAELVEKLHVNSAKHQKNFSTAKQGFHLELKEELEDKLAKLEAGEKVDLIIRSRPPENHYPDYQDALEMLGWDTGDTVELTETQFREWVQDRWHWRDQWFASNSGYITKASMAVPS